MSLEPGIGGVWYKRNETVENAKMYLSPKIDVGFHLGDMVEIRASYKMLLGDDTMHSFLTIYGGFALRKYK